MAKLYINKGTPSVPNWVEVFDAGSTIPTATNADTVDSEHAAAFVKHSLATATSDFLVGTVGAWVKKTLAETRAILKHAITSTGDHTSTATSGKMLKADANGLPVDATNTDTDVADAVTKKHAKDGDTALGALGTKNPPIDADKSIYRDSTASDALVTSTWTQIKAFLKTYFDTIYAALSHAHAGTDITSGTIDGDRLPAMSAAKKGGVPATGAPAGKYLKDDGTFDTPAGGGGGTVSRAMAYMIAQGS